MHPRKSRMHNKRKDCPLIVSREMTTRKKDTTNHNPHRF